MILVFSSNSNRSDQVVREVERAAAKGIPVLPLRIEDVSPNKSMEFFIGSTHWLDAISPPLERHLEQLTRTVLELLAPGSVGAREPLSDTSGRQPGGPTRDEPVEPEEARRSGVNVASATIAGSFQRAVQRWRSLGGHTRAALAGVTMLALAAIGSAVWVGAFSSDGPNGETGAMQTATPMTSTTGSPATPDSDTTAGASPTGTATAAPSATRVPFGEGIEIAQVGTGGPTVLVDESQGQRVTTDPDRAAQIDPLNPQWVTLTFPPEMLVHRDARTSLNVLDLASYDVIVLPCPALPGFEPAEIEAVRDYVTSGGGLMLLGMHGTPANCATDFGGAGEEFGVAFDPSPVLIPAGAPERGQDEGSFLIRDITPHEAIDGILAEEISANYAASIEPDDSWDVLARTPPEVWRDADLDNRQDEGEETGPFVLLAVKEQGAGRVVAIADEWLFFDQLPQERIREQILGWLAHLAPTKPIRVLVDEVHGRVLTADPDRAVELNPDNPVWLVFGSGTEVERLESDPLSEAVLAEHDVLVLSCAGRRPYDNEEVQAITRFVEAGGGVLFIGAGLPPPGCTAGAAGGALGFAFAPGVLASTTGYNDPHVFSITDLADHAIADGVSSTNWTWGTALELSPEWTVIASAESATWNDLDRDGQLTEGEPQGPFPTCAALEIGKGRVVSIGDWGAFDQFEQQPLLRGNILAWLARHK